MSYAADRQRYGTRPAPSGGRSGAAYRAAVKVVKTRAREGEPCCFCGGAFLWGLHHNDPRAFTAHHGERLMDGGAVVPDPSTMFPAHRGCNSGDGLRAQNRRRALQKGAPAQGAHTVIITESDTEPHSREW